MVDGYRAAVAGALKWARRRRQGVRARSPCWSGTSPPTRSSGSRNLAASAKDGVRNHLWKAFKAAIKRWFWEKVEEVLGLGLTVWNLLKKGGLSLARIGDDGVGGDQGRDPADADPDPDREADLAADPGRRGGDADHRDAAGGVGHDPARPRGVRALLRVPQGGAHRQAPARSSPTRSPRPRSRSSTSSPTGCSSDCASPPARSPRSSRRSPRSSARSSPRSAKKLFGRSGRKPKKLKGKATQEAQARQARQGRAARQGRDRVPRQAARPRALPRPVLWLQMKYARAALARAHPAPRPRRRARTLDRRGNPSHDARADRRLQRQDRHRAVPPACRAVPEASSASTTTIHHILTAELRELVGGRSASTGTHPSTCSNSRTPSTTPCCTAATGCSTPSAARVRPATERSRRSCGTRWNVEWQLWLVPRLAKRVGQARRRRRACARKAVAQDANRRRRSSARCIVTRGHRIDLLDGFSDPSAVSALRKYRRQGDTTWASTARRFLLQRKKRDREGRRRRPRGSAAWKSAHRATWQASTPEGDVRRSSHKALAEGGSS